MSMQGVTVTPKFVFGCNGQINNSIHMHEEKNLVYVAGHNVIVYNLDEGQQVFIPGSEQCDEINFLTISLTGRFIAICEKAQEGRAQVNIWEIQGKRKKKTLPEPEMENLPIECKEFLSCAFSPTLEKQHLVTLSGEGDWCAILWQWDQLKMLAKVDLNVVEPNLEELRTFQISLHPVMGLACVVTGFDTYHYMKLEENFRAFNVTHTELQTGRDDISTEYTCHAWAKDQT